MRDEVVPEAEITDWPRPTDMFYHWSPSDRRESIQAHGLKIRSQSPHIPIKFPFICLSSNALKAWLSSGGVFIIPEVKSWDLWGIWVEDVPSFEVIPHDDNTPREFRVYRSIPAKYTHYLATRSTSEQG